VLHRLFFRPGMLHLGERSRGSTHTKCCIKAVRGCFRTGSFGGTPTAANCDAFLCGKCANRRPNSLRTGCCHVCLEPDTRLSGSLCSTVAVPRTARSAPQPIPNNVRRPPSRQTLSASLLHTHRGGETLFSDPMTRNSCVSDGTCANRLVWRYLSFF
jgi:hypothetical protein